MPDFSRSLLDWWSALFALALLAAGGSGASAETSSVWMDGYNSRARILAGNVAGRVWAGVEIVLAPGWKTYWRHPGDGGGVPPMFEFSKSENLMAATVSYPAPKRMKDAAGDAIGYADRVLFPVRLVPRDPAKAVTLQATIEYGICKEICVPVEAEMTLVVPPGLTDPAPAVLTNALDKVPRIAPQLKGGDPQLGRKEARLDGDKPRLQFEVDFGPGGTAGADAFIEAPDGIYVPQPAPVRTEGAKVTFEADLGTGVDPAELKGKQLTLTLVGASGQSQATWQLD